MPCEVSRPAQRHVIHFTQRRNWHLGLGPIFTSVKYTTSVQDYKFHLAMALGNKNSRMSHKQRNVLIT